MIGTINHLPSPPRYRNIVLKFDNLYNVNINIHLFNEDVYFPSSAKENLLVVDALMEHCEDINVSKIVPEDTTFQLKKSYR